jgi:RNA polymerase sigma-70 factor (ECF subfamily)
MPVRIDRSALDLRADPDAILLRRYRICGDRAAFEALFRKYQEPIYGFVVRLVGAEDAYDLTQEVFLRVMRSARSFRGDSTFRTWLYTIARHICYNHCRSLKRRQDLECLFGDSGDIEDTAEQIPNTKMDVERIVETQELQRIVVSVLDSLTMEQRLLITLCDFEGMSYDEIAKIAELTVASVRSKLHRARLAFKTRFQPYWKALYSDDSVPAGEPAYYASKPAADLALLALAGA